MDRVAIPITDPNYQSIIQAVDKVINEILYINEHELIEYGRYAEKFQTDFYRGVLILMWRESIEIADGIRSLVLGSSCNVIAILLRSLFEIYLGITFIFSDKEQVTKRALSYSAVNLFKRIEQYKRLDLSDSTYEEFRKNSVFDIGKSIPSNFDVKAARENLESIFEKYPEYAEVKKEYDKILSKKRKNGRKRPQVQWYELFGGCSSIFQLSELLNMKDFYSIVYDYFSRKSHGLDSTSDWVQGGLKNPKVPDLSELSSDIDLMLSFLSGITRCILQFERPEQLQKFAQKHCTVRAKVAFMANDLKQVQFTK
mgnify:CR=1 FL=1